MMNNAIDCYATLYFNPFILAPILRAFYEKAHVQPKNILLSYLVLPMVLTESTKKTSTVKSSKTFLVNSNSASSLRSYCKEASRLHGLPERIQEFRQLCQLCIQYLLDSGEIIISEDLSVLVKESRLNSSICPDGTIKAAQHLGNLFDEMDVVSIFRMLGVKKL